ncbi:MAG TPA: hypothetical protein VJ486_12790 [Geothrix sp.]|nr:hypothetical protein [Geothrix sp.]
MSRDPFSMPDLTAAILARTSGPACARLRALACDLANGSLAGDDLLLAEGHLAHCPACQTLVRTLFETGRVLPAFAQVAPGAAFTASVLALTQPRRPVQPPDHLREAWSRFIRRPRAALESAYLATAAGLILTQMPLPSTMDRAGTALVSRVRAESRARLAAPGPQAWAARLQHSRTARLLGPSPSPWRGFWTRLTQGFHHAWSACSRALHSTAERLGFRSSAPSSTEPSGASRRPAS